MHQPGYKENDSLPASRHLAAGNVSTSIGLVIEAFTDMTISQLREAAQEIWQSALDAARPEVCIPRAIRVTGDGFAVGDETFALDGRLVVIGAGKAGAGMAQVVERLFNDSISAGLVITKYGSTGCRPITSRYSRRDILCRIDPENWPWRECGKSCVT